MKQKGRGDRADILSHNELARAGDFGSERGTLRKQGLATCLLPETLPIENNSPSSTN